MMSKLKRGTGVLDVATPQRSGFKQRTGIYVDLPHPVSHQALLSIQGEIEGWF